MIIIPIVMTLVGILTDASSTHASKQLLPFETITISLGYW